MAPTVRAKPNDYREGRRVMKHVLGVAPSEPSAESAIDPPVKGSNSGTPTYIAFENSTKDFMGPYSTLEETLTALDTDAHAGLWTVCMKVMNHRVFRVVQ
jgi:hypothetical protein